MISANAKNVGLAFLTLANTVLLLNPYFWLFGIPVYLISSIAVWFSSHETWLKTVFIAAPLAAFILIFLSLIVLSFVNS